MMKKLLGITLIILFFGVQLNAQVLTVGKVSDFSRQVNRDNNILNSKGESFSLNEIKGSPYLNENFVKGRIISTDGKSLSLFLRYRIFDDVFEMKQNSGDSKILNLKRSKDYKVLVNNREFVFLKHLPFEIRGTKNGYAEVIAKPQKGNENSVYLYKRMSQELVNRTTSRNPYGHQDKPSLKQSNYYFLGVGDKLVQIKPDKRKAYKAFPKHNKAMKKFISKNRLKFRGRNTDRDLKRLVNYYNRQQAQQ